MSPLSKIWTVTRPDADGNEQATTTDAVIEDMQDDLVWDNSVSTDERDVKTLDSKSAPDQEERVIAKGPVDRHQSVSNVSALWFVSVLTVWCVVHVCSAPSNSVRFAAISCRAIWIRTRWFSASRTRRRSPSRRGIAAPV